VGTCLCSDAPLRPPSAAARPCTFGVGCSMLGVRRSPFALSPVPSEVSHSFSVHVSLDGTFGIDFRADPDLTQYVKTNFRGQLENSENLGKTMADLIAQWNADPANAEDKIAVA